MARGGKRDGAGRPAGAVTKRTREVGEKAAREGITPLEYMLSILRNDAADPKDRMWAAEKAAPYVHAKLASVEVKGDPDNPIQHHHKVELVALTPNDSAD